MTAMSNPNPATLRKKRSSMRPASMRLECPSRAIRAAPARSCAGTPTDLARSHPVPAGTRPMAASTPERMMALPTLLQVPSPPTATMRRNPRPSASMVRRPSSPAAVVTPWAAPPPSACSTGAIRRAPLPLPDRGLKTTKRSSAGAATADQAVSSSTSGSKVCIPARIHSSRNGTS